MSARSVLKPIVKPMSRRRPLRGPASDVPEYRLRHDPVVGCGVYVDGRRVPRDGDYGHDYASAAELARKKGGFVWLGLFEPTAQDLAGIAKEFDLHPLAVEDAVQAHQRPKLERYDDMLFMVLKTCTYVEHAQLTATSEVIATGEVMVFLGPDYVITVRHGEHGALHGLRQRLEDEHELLRLGPSAVLYAVADHVVDAYVEVSERVELDLDEVETSVFSPKATDDVGRIYQLKRQLLDFRRSVMPLSTPLRVLAERPMRLVQEDTREYFRDVEDHLARVRDSVSGMDELLTSILQASAARTTAAESKDMRKISSWAAIGIVPTAMAGIWGMNFTHMPELDWTLGYPLALGAIFTVCFALYRGFKRNGWL